MPSRAVIRRTARPTRVVRVLLACAVGHAAAQTAAAHPAGAQRVPPPSLTSGPAVGPYERARRLVEQGQGALGRAVADSLVAASPAGSPALAEALWWRATLSADGTRAEQDLRRIVDEFSSSPRVGDATVRIAQLDLSRDRPDVAAPALARLVRERPDDPARAQAAYWLARARFELGDTRGGCTALANAAAWARSSETFTRQQVMELWQRLPACDPSSVVAAVPPGTPAPPRPTPPAPSQTVTQASAVPGATPMAPATRPATNSARLTDSLETAELRQRHAVVNSAPGTPPARQPRAATAAVSAPVPAPIPAAVATVATVAPPPARPTATTAATRTPSSTLPMASAPAAPITSPALTPAAKPAPAAAVAPAADAGGNFAVQIAAYGQRDGAESLAGRLRARGFDARATGRVAPFRVKIGRYATRAAAAAARATFAGQGVAGFVTDAGDGPPGR